jgi:hypothetical protein
MHVQSLYAAMCWQAAMCQVMRLTIYFKFYEDLSMLFHSVALNSVQSYKMATCVVFLNFLLPFSLKHYISTVLPPIVSSHKHIQIAEKYLVTTCYPKRTAGY